MQVGENSIDGIVTMTERAQARFVVGDSTGYEELFAHREDVTLTGPFGGSPLVGWSTIAPRMRQAAALFDAGGSGSIEVFQAIVSGEALSEFRSWAGGVSRRRTMSGPTATFA